MSIAVEEKTQTTIAIEMTQSLLDELKRATDFGETKDAIMRYVSNMDGCSHGPWILGDADFAHLFAQSLERRGKTPVEKWAPLLIQCVRDYDAATEAVQLTE